MHDKNRGIRVLRAISRLNTGGPARHVVILNARLDGAFESLLVSGLVKEYEGDMSYLAEEYGIDVRFVPSLGREVSFFDDVRSFFTLLKIIRSFRPDIVHTHASKAGALGRLAAVIAGVPVIVHTFHGHVFQGYFGRRSVSLILGIERFLGRYTSAIVTLSHSQMTDITGKYRVAPKSKVKVVPLGLDLAPYMDADRFSGTLRQSLEFKNGTIVVATAGRLVAIKDHVAFLKAAKAVLGREDSVRFVIVGDGEMKSSLQVLSRELGISHAVHFTGWVKDMCTVYPDVDIFVQSSINEGTPVSVIEAMACGCCVVATRAGGTADVVRDRENGLTVPVGDVDALAAAILRAAGDAKLRAEFGERAREASKLYDAERLAGDMERLYLELVGKGL